MDRTRETQGQSGQAWKPGDLPAASQTCFWRFVEGGSPSIRFMRRARYIQEYIQEDVG